MEAKKKQSGLATAGMVLGIIAIVLSFIPVINFIAIILGALAFIFGVVALIKKASTGKAVTAVILGALSVVIAVVMLMSIGKAVDDATTKSSDQKSTSETTKDSDKRLTLDKGWKLDKSSPYMTQVVGTVSNNSDKAVDGYIQITFSALDADGANVGDCLANANTVDAHGKWKFKATCSGDDIKTVHFKELSGF